MNKIGVVIPAYQNQIALDKCIDALKKSSFNGHIEVFIRDNSIDNIYWTKAVNQGLRHLRKDCEAFLVLNQDAYVLPDTISKLVNVLESDPLVGITCPLQIDHNSNKTYWGGSLDAFPFGRHLTQPFSSYKGNFKTYWANGAAMLIDASLINEIGLFDENMKFICSDSDYSFTARSRGFEIIAVSDAIVMHSAGQSGASTNKNLNIIKLKDALYFAKKWLTNQNYIDLSFEGKNLTQQEIINHISNLQQQLEKLDSIN